MKMTPESSTFFVFPRAYHSTWPVNHLSVPTTRGIMSVRAPRGRITDNEVRRPHGFKRPSRRLFLPGQLQDGLSQAASPSSPTDGGAQRPPLIFANVNVDHICSASFLATAVRAVLRPLRLVSRVWRCLSLSSLRQACIAAEECLGDVVDVKKIKAEALARAKAEGSPEKVRRIIEMVEAGPVCLHWRNLGVDPKDLSKSRGVGPDLSGLRSRKEEVFMRSLRK